MMMRLIHAPAAEDAGAGQPGPGRDKARAPGQVALMDNSFLVGLSAQRVLRQRMDITANNLANMSTSGFSPFFAFSFLAIGPSERNRKYGSPGDSPDCPAKSAGDG